MMLSLLPLLILFVAFLDVIAFVAFVVFVSFVVCVTVKIVLPSVHPLTKSFTHAMEPILLRLALVMQGS